METTAKKNKKEHLITVTLSALIGKNVDGMKAQVTNPRFLKPDGTDTWNSPCFRKLKEIKTFKESGKNWVQLHWYGEGERCTFTGCTIESDSCAIQFTESDFKKLQSK